MSTVRQLRVPASYINGLPGFDEPVLAGELLLADGALRFEEVRLEGMTVQRQRLFTLPVSSVAGMTTDAERYDRLTAMGGVFQEGMGAVPDEAALVGGLFNVAYAQAVIGGKTYFVMLWGLLDDEPFVAGFAASKRDGGRLRDALDEERTSTGLRPLEPLEEWWPRQAGPGRFIPLDPEGKESRQSIEALITSALLNSEVPLELCEKEVHLTALSGAVRVLDQRRVLVYDSSSSDPDARAFLVIPEPMPPEDEVARWLLSLVNAVTAGTS